MEKAALRKALGNKGEWSEFYTLLKLLEDNQLHAADGDLNVIPDKYFIVLKIIRQEALTGKTEYNLNQKSGLVSIQNDNEEVAVFDSANLKGKVQSIFAQMKAAPDTTFGIATAEKLMKELHCTQIKASSGNKADLTLVIHDRISPTTPELGFSIKSMLGSPSTLLNASSGTNLTYTVLGKIDVSKINQIEGTSKIRDRIEAIEDARGEIEFKGVESETFRRNLRKIDTVFPEILAELLKAFFEGKGRTIKELVESLDGSNNLAKKFGLNKSDYEYKIKNFLVAVALGMTPQHEWNGLSAAQGGYIVVKENGDIVAYHLYNRDEFQDYLYRSTKLETPSTGRHKFGTIYKEGGKNFIKLNLQVRFTR